jgi:cytochrome c oxidase assembly protein subunit 15
MKQSNKLIGQWLMLGVVMLIIQVLLGGITRLTGSGLSITEWKPILGALPPLNESDWLKAFEQYKQIAQFKFMNQDFTLGDFKFIYFWEWFHRNWARFIGVAFLIPFIYFLYKKMITKEMVPKLIGLFLLGIAQGLIGWIMVASGLNDENLYVSHIRLAIHFISALVLIAFTYWFALSLLVKPEDRVEDTGLRKMTITVISILFVQLIYGAFMAGLKAATVAPTWPSINGDYFPAVLGTQSWINHPINIHFVHRMLAYILVFVIIYWYLKAIKNVKSAYFNRFKWIPLGLVIIQLVLGISTVLFSTQIARNSFGQFEWSAQLHQIVAMLLVMSFVWVLFVLKRKGV